MATSTTRLTVEVIRADAVRIDERLALIEKTARSISAWARTLGQDSIQEAFDRFAQDLIWARKAVTERYNIFEQLSALHEVTLERHYKPDSERVH